MIDAIENINTKSYWNRRFEIDWIENGGKEQSRFFATLAYRHLPAWLLARLEVQGVSLCDWGCAQGDGTAAFQRATDVEYVTGIDFSDVAVFAARTRYPHINFLCKNLLNEDFDGKFDVVFTSNTLEHFAEPWIILNTIARVCIEHLIVLVPFREVDRCAEHYYTFDLGNIPSTVGTDFVLTHKEIIAAQKEEESYWLGEQVLLIYSRDDRFSQVLQKEINLGGHS